MVGEGVLDDRVLGSRGALGLVVQAGFFCNISFSDLVHGFGSMQVWGQPKKMQAYGPLGLFRVGTRLAGLSVSSL